MDDESILKTVRGALGLDADDNSFDFELLLHINNALAVLNQNGVGVPLTVTDETEVWIDIQDVRQVEGNMLFQSVKQYVFLKTKILFDPPPPSTVKYMDEAATELLWRLRESFDLPYLEEVIE